MSVKKLKGLIAAPFTPMKDDGSLNLEKIPAYYDWLKYNGVNGVFICGSTGEGPSLSFEEKKMVNRAWAQLTHNDPGFFAMTLVGGNSLSECRSLAQHAADQGIDGISFTSPYYFKPQEVAQLAASCAVVASAVPELPFYYYHIPVLTGVGFPMLELLKEMDGKVENLAGIKYTHEDFMDYQSCLNYQQGKYDMLWGRDENMLAALALGAEGAVGSTYNYAAPVYHDLLDAFSAGDLVRARILQQQAIDMIRMLGKYGGIATGKAFMKLAGFDCGGFRLPVHNMSPAKWLDFQQEARQKGFSEICSRNPELNKESNAK